MASSPWRLLFCSQHMVRTALLRDKDLRYATDCVNNRGMANSFGVFQTYYSSTLLKSSTPSAISWIGSIQGFLLLFVGVFCGRAFDGGYFYHVASLGVFLSVFGMMMTSLATQYWQVFLAQGVCLGLGSGCLFTPGISLVGQYFSTKRVRSPEAAFGGNN